MPPAAQRTGLTRAAARRHLLTLAHLGYLERMAATSGWRPRCCGFRAATWHQPGLPRVLQPTLNRLAAQTQQSFSAVVLDGDEVVIVARSGCMARVTHHGLWPAPGRGCQRTPHLPGGCCWPRCPRPSSRSGCRAARCNGSRPTPSRSAAPRARWWPRCGAMIFAWRWKSTSWACMPWLCLCNLQGHTVAALNVVASPQQMQAQTPARHAAAAAGSRARGAWAAVAPRGLAHAGLCGLSRHCL